jgi:hypothetical protein
MPSLGLDAAAWPPGPRWRGFELLATPACQGLYHGRDVLRTRTPNRRKTQDQSDGGGRHADEHDVTGMPGYVPADFEQHELHLSKQGVVPDEIRWATLLLARRTVETI